MELSTKANTWDVHEDEVAVLDQGTRGSDMDGNEHQTALCGRLLHLLAGHDTTQAQQGNLPDAPFAPEN